LNEVHIAGYTFAWWIKIPFFFLIWVIPLLFVKNLAFIIIKKLASQTQTKIDDIFIESAQWPASLVIVASFGFILHRILPSSSEHQLAFILIFFKVVTIVALALFIDRFCIGLLESYEERIEILKTAGGIIHGAVHLVVLSLGTLVLLDTLGVSVTPVLASLGIGSLAVALAIQPTLENFFSGIQLIVDKPIQPGQVIKLDSGEEGVVFKIGWRSTWVKLGDNNIIILPNKSIVNSKITNYCYPDKNVIIRVQCGVHYNSDLEQVERIAKEVAKDVLHQVSGGVKEFEPVVLFHTFGDFSINFVVVLKVAEFGHNAQLKHEFIKHLHRRFNKEGIVIPYPIQAVNYDQEKAYVHFEDRSELAK
jgi:small-conductance mechanosensitive channel